jgi:hypothetical protein
MATTPLLINIYIEISKLVVGSCGVAVLFPLFQWCFLVVRFSGPTLGHLSLGPQYRNGPSESPGIPITAEVYLLRCLSQLNAITAADHVALRLNPLNIGERQG